MSRLNKSFKNVKGRLLSSNVLKTLGYTFMGLLAIALFALIVVGSKSISDIYSLVTSSNQEINKSVAVAVNAKIPNAKLTNVSEDAKNNINGEIESKDAKNKRAVSIKQKKEIKMLVFGDEIAQSKGVDNQDSKWLDIFKKQLAIKYGFTISEDTYMYPENTVFGSWVDFSGEIQNNDKDYDLVVICQGKNEGNCDYLSFTSVYEELVRRVLKTYPGVQILLIGENSAISEDYYQTLSKISNYYGLAYADLREGYNISGKKAQELTDASGYPNSEGYKLYASTAINAISYKIDLNQNDNFDFRVPLFGGMGEFQDYFRISSFKETNNEASKIEKYKKRFLNLTKPNDSISYTISGSLFGLYALAGPDSGKIKVYVDDFFVNEVDLYSPNETYKRVLLNHKRRYAKHVVKLVVSEESNTKSNGNNAYIFGIISNTKISDSE